MYKIYKNEVVSLKTDTGKRKNNEDSILEISHPFNNSYKLLAVADGVGGSPNGELASTYVLNKLRTYFKLTPTFILRNQEFVLKYITEVIKNINNSLIKNNNKYFDKDEGPATTLTCAIVLEDVTIILSIGDSRAYAVINNKLVQITEDNSYVWQLYKDGIIRKDDIRFRTDNNIITKCLGRTENNEVSVTVLDNNNYEGLLLFTDGVTDCLSDKKIKYIYDTYSYEDIADEIVYQAVHMDQNDNVPKGRFYKKPTCGKDNSSAVVYIKK